jgi:hypothetical protein
MPRKDPMLSIRGSMILSVAVGMVLLTGILFFTLKTNRTTRQGEIRYKDATIAGAYATELLEFLRTYRTHRLQDYLGTNPYASKPPYYLCSHINALDRASGAIVNEDPLATLPDNNSLTWQDPDATQNLKIRPNRYYQVSIVNIMGDSVVGYATTDGLVIRKDYCDRSASAVPSAGNLSSYLNVIDNTETLRFLITVGVTWVPKGKTVADVQRVVLSTIIPPGQ